MIVLLFRADGGSQFDWDFCSDDGLEKPSCRIKKDMVGCVSLRGNHLTLNPDLIVLSNFRRSTCKLSRRIKLKMNDFG